MELPKIDFERLSKDLKREDTMQLVKKEDGGFDSVRSKLKEQLEDLARGFEVLSYDFAPDNECKKFCDLLRYVNQQIA